MSAVYILVDSLHLFSNLFLKLVLVLHCLKCLYMSCTCALYAFMCCVYVQLVYCNAVFFMYGSAGVLGERLLVSPHTVSAVHDWNDNKNSNLKSLILSSVTRL